MSQPGGTVVAPRKSQLKVAPERAAAVVGGAMVSVDRAQVMAFRVAALGLAEGGDQRPADLPVLDLGVQEYMPGSQRAPLAAAPPAALDDDRLIAVWAARGAPHLHRRADLAALV